MTDISHPARPIPSDRLRFACGCCGSPLEVPAALAGVSGPCPLCGELITAPAAENNSVRGNARLLAKPPLRREIPPPLAPVSENRPALSAVRPLPVAASDTFCAEAPRAPELPVRPIPLPADNEPELAMPPVAVERPSAAPAANSVSFPSRRELVRQPPAEDRLPPREGGIFDHPAGTQGHEFDIRQAAPALRRHGWKRWLDIAIVSVFTGVLLVSVAALRFTVPVEVKPPSSLPPNLTQLVERETENASLRRGEAEQLACAAVNRYLGAASEQAAASHLLSPPEGIAPPAFPPFTGALPSTWIASASRRIPLTDRYLITVQPPDGTGPLFVVEQTDHGPRIHAGPVTQQSAGLFEKFTATPGHGEATLYVEIRPAHPDGEHDYRANRPDLASMQFVDVRPAFPGAAVPLIACFKPDSEAGQQFARRAHDRGYRRAIVHLRWQQHREAGPWAELVKIIPSPWSGDPPAIPPAATAFNQP